MSSVPFEEFGCTQLIPQRFFFDMGQHIFSSICK